MNRRGFLQAILAAGVAPAFIGSSVLMPVRKVWTLEESMAWMETEIKRRTFECLQSTHKVPWSDASFLPDSIMQAMAEEVAKAAQLPLRYLIPQGKDFIITLPLN